MREILFHGKQIKDGKWIEGYYCPKPYSHFPCEPTIFPVETINKDWHGERVDPETVCQFTGLHDKNGRKIFEGDIVRYGDTIHRVVFEQRNGTAYFGIVISDIETWLFGNECPASLVDIVGNIYDNPEMLKGGNENG